jgi:hypothetical protein
MEIASEELWTTIAAVESESLRILNSGVSYKPGERYENGI